MDNLHAIEKKWQKRWEEKKAFVVKEDKKKKYFILEMFPYPSASSLHMGHAFNYIIGDIYARFKRMQGFNVLYPMGYDAFGLPAENAAIKERVHPKSYTEQSIKKFIIQQKKLGLSYDWTRMLKTCDPEYYRWNQFFFLKFLEKGLVYRKKASVNWCPKCITVLANEQVHNGTCWRHTDTQVEIKQLEQWFFKITNYAEELLKDIDKLDWPERIKIMQRNWIGKSEGAEIIFTINNKPWKIFTTRPDTLFGVTFMVISAQHPHLMELVTPQQKKEVETFLRKIRTTKQEDLDTVEKEGVFTGSYALHPITKEKIPVYAGNFVVAEYGSGMVMAVPAHDQRDFEFAKKYNIPIKQVVAPHDRIVVIAKSLKREFFDKIKEFADITQENELICINTKKVDEVFNLAEKLFIGDPWYIHSEGRIKKILFHSKEENKVFDWSKYPKEAKEYGERIGITKEQLDFDEIYKAYTNEGTLINSDKFNGLSSEEARKTITSHLEQKGLAKKSVQYKLRDWLISRQRYWGTPIPIIYCENCGIVPVPEKDLPVLLPEKVTFGKGNPLATNEKFVNIKCPTCKKPARRETDTMDTFVDSSWYFLRYIDNKNSKAPFDTKKAAYWMPVDQYIGGAEHATMHLIYARFFTKVLRDLGYLTSNEPFSKLFNQGMLHKDGFVMAKSRGNVVLPEEVSAQYGIDTARFFLVSLAAPDKDREWSEAGIAGSARFVNKVREYCTQVKMGKTSTRLQHYINKAVKEITEDLEHIHYNLATIKLRELFEKLNSEEEIGRDDMKIVITLITPFCPHIAEELWEQLGKKGFVSLASWPTYDKKKIDEQIDKQEQATQKVIADIINITILLKEKQGREAKKIYLYVLPQEANSYDEGEIQKRVQKDITIFTVNNKNKYDPQNKAAKAKPGKPAIYVE